MLLGAIVAVRAPTAPGTVAGDRPVATSQPTGPATAFSDAVSPHLITTAAVNSLVGSMTFSPDGKTLAVMLAAGVVDPRVGFAHD